MIGTGCALAIVPAGSGNGFARHFNIPSDPGKVIQVINTMHERWIDTVKINQKTYLGVAGLGFDVDVSLAFSNLDVAALLLIFLLLSRPPLYRSRDYALIIDGKAVNERAFLICFANSKQ